MATRSPDADAVATRSQRPVTVVPLAPEHVDAAACVTVAALAPRPQGPGGAPTEADAARTARMRDRIASARETDAGGAWVALAGERVVGLAIALRSDGVWVLSLLGVDPSLQGGGVGGTLLARALEHADGCRGAMIASSTDPRAIRLYARAGFSLLPTVAASGPVDRRALPAGLDARVEVTDDVERTAAVDAAVRGGARPAHLAQLLTVEGVRLYVARGDRGYAIRRGGRVLGVAAHDEPTAQALLWRALADVPAATPALVEYVTSGQDWAIDVALRAGLLPRPDGPVFVRGRLGPLRPFLPTGAYL